MGQKRPAPGNRGLHTTGNQETQCSRVAVSPALGWPRGAHQVPLHCPVKHKKTTGPTCTSMNKKTTKGTVQPKGKQEGGTKSSCEGREIIVNAEPQPRGPTTPEIY